MNDLKNLEKKIFELPKKRTQENAFIPSYLRSIYDEFLESLDGFEDEKGLIKEKFEVLQSICNDLVETNEIYLEGSPVRAFEKLDQALKKMGDDLWIPKKDIISSRPARTLFRARVGEDRNFRQRDLFHIPFELRHIVKTQRYSIPGLPCLYLANTVYCCWEELRRPNLSDFHVSRVEFERYSWKMLDLSIISNHKAIYKMSKEDDESPLNSDQWLIHYLMLWPLATACSLVCLNDEAIFKQEYILPQLLLQWVSMEQDLDGIIFSSTRQLDDPFENGGTLRNFVIPVKTVSSDGFCPYLAQRIKISEPLKAGDLNLDDPNSIVEKPSEEDIKNWIEIAGIGGQLLLKLDNEQPKHYLRSPFGKLEIELCKQTTNLIAIE